MRTTTEPAPAQPSPSTAPLARDADGHQIPLPEGAAAWRIRRHTGGRPRHHLDAHKQPMLFPLQYSIADVEDILPPGTYRLDLIDAQGESLDITVPITTGAHRNANDSRAEVEEEQPSEAVSTKLPASGSDVRLVLEANIRATQLAFQHNERTLAASLRMADTLREGVHVLAESQADWIKSIASSRGFLRNAAPPPHFAAPLQVESRDDEDDDEEYEPPKDDRLMEFGMAAMTLVNNLFENLRGPKPTGTTNQGKQSAGFDLRSLLDWRRSAPPAEEPAPRLPTASSPADMMRIVAALPPEFMAKLREVREQLTPDEQSRLMPFVMAIAPDDLPAIAAEIMPKTIDEIAAIFRAQLAKVAKE